MHWIRRSLILLLTLAAWPGMARAQQPVTLDVSIDRNQVTVGDRIAVSLVLHLPAGATPDLTGLDQQFGNLDVLLIGLPEEKALPDGSREVRVRYEVAAFRPGSFQVPALTVPFKMADGSPGAVTSASIPVTVQSVLPADRDPGDVRDLKPQIDLPYSAGISRRTIVMLALVCAAAVIALALVGRRRLVRRETILEAPVAVEPDAGPEAAARAELDRIAGLGLLEQGDLRTYHALIARCMRRYLSDRYGFPAFAMTTSELAARMEDQGVDRWPARLAAGLLSECDAVNYAGYAPATPRAESNLAIAYEIVEITREGAAAVPVVR